MTSNASIVGAVSPSSVMVGQTATLTATVTTDGTTPAPDGTPVAFTGQDANNNVINLSATTVGGVATATYAPTGSNGAGNIDWTATALGVTSNEFALTQSAESPQMSVFRYVEF